MPVYARFYIDSSAGGMEAVPRLQALGRLSNQHSHLPVGNGAARYAPRNGKCVVEARFSRLPGYFFVQPRRLPTVQHSEKAHILPAVQGNGQQCKVRPLVGLRVCFVFMQ